MKKKILSFALSALILFSAIPVHASDLSSQSVVINGTNYSFNTFRSGDCTMLPVRDVSQAMGFTVEWNEADRSVTVIDNDWQAVLYIGIDSYIAHSNTMLGMTAPQTYGAAPVIIDEKTYAPVNMFELLYCIFDEKDNTIFISSKKDTENNAQ